MKAGLRLCHGGPPGIFCHGLAIRPGKPTLLAECGGVPLIGLPGHPLSALVVFRLVGLPVLHRLAGCVTPPPEPHVRARLSRQVASAAGRLDGYVIVPEAATGLAAGTEVKVTLYR